MRSEQEMLQLIRQFVEGDERIRAAVLNGSRANPNVTRDPFQDFDVACLVRDVQPFIGDPNLVRFFGEPMIVQEPEAMGDPPADDDGHYSYLMQFMDGNRIDLSFWLPAQWTRVLRDSLTLPLVDKDGLLTNLPAPSEASYLPHPPDNKAFQDCCNEFWWVNPYVAKGLWRRELIYAKTMLDEVLRAQLMKMLTWTFGVRTGFQRAPGKLGKRFESFFGPELWNALKQTYADADLEHTWESLFAMDDLFRRLALEVAAARGFAYPHGDDERVRAYLRKIKSLPREALEI